MRRTAWLLLLLCAGCASCSSPEGRPQKENEEDWKARTTSPNPWKDRVLASKDVPELLASARDVMRDQELPGRYATVRQRSPGVDWVLEWSKSNLTWEALGQPQAVRVESVVGEKGDVGGVTVCIRGRILEATVLDGAAAFTFVDADGLVSGGWLVGVNAGAPKADDDVEVCGILIGRRIQQGVYAPGLFIVGLSR